MSLNRREFLGLLGATALAGAFPIRSAFAGGASACGHYWRWGWWGNHV